MFLGREKQTSTLLTRRELKLTAKPTSICSINNYIFQQDGASSYISRASPDYLTEYTNQFIKIDEWPPQSAGCNPMDYAIWDMLSERVYAGRIHEFTEPELTQKILKVWQEISLTENWASIYLFGKRAQVCCWTGRRSHCTPALTVRALRHDRFFVFDMLMLKIAWWSYFLFNTFDFFTSDWEHIWLFNLKITVKLWKWQYL